MAVEYQNELNNASLLRSKGEGEAYKGEMAFRTGMLKAGGKMYSNSQTGSILTGN